MANIRSGAAAWSNEYPGQDKARGREEMSIDRINPHQPQANSCKLLFNVPRILKAGAIGRSVIVRI